MRSFNRPRCSNEGCDRHSYASGLCLECFSRLQRVRAVLHRLKLARRPKGFRVECVADNGDTTVMGTYSTYREADTYRRRWTAEETDYCRYVVTEEK